MVQESKKKDLYTLHRLEVWPPSPYLFLACLGGASSMYPYLEMVCTGYVEVSDLGSILGAHVFDLFHFCFDLLSYDVPASFQIQAFET